MADRSDRSDDFADVEKMSTHSNSDASSSITLPTRLTGSDAAEHGMEKTPSRATDQSRAGGQPVHRIQTAQDWTGPDDPENPLNWPVPKKIYHTLIPALQCFTM